jgi:hypothetical protein
VCGLSVWDCNASTVKNTGVSAKLHKAVRAPQGTVVVDFFGNLCAATEPVCHSKQQTL